MKESILHFIQNSSIFIGVLLVTILVAFVVNRLYMRLIRNSTEFMKNDPTNYLFLRHAITAIIYIFGFSMAIYAVPSLRTLAGSLLAGAGILAVAIGFASQHALSNIISGLFIVLFKPFRVNDRLTVRTFSGIVEDISLRHTVIRDFENKRILVPNTLISDEILINADFVDDKICKWIDIKISFNCDIDLARKIISEEIIKHPLHMDPRNEEQKQTGVPEAIVRVLSLDLYAINLRAWAWAKDPSEGFVLSCDVYENVVKRFEAEGVELAVPHRIILNKPAS